MGGGGGQVCFYSHCVLVGLLLLLLRVYKDSICFQDALWLGSKHQFSLQISESGHLLSVLSICS